eukprot:2260185-Prymnesium_polylepis.1
MQVARMRRAPRCKLVEPQRRATRSCAPRTGCTQSALRVRLSAQRGRRHFGRVWRHGREPSVREWRARLVRAGVQRGERGAVTSPDELA